MGTLAAVLVLATPVAAQELAFDTVRLDVDKADSVDTVDLNSDGRPDLVVAAGRTAKIFLYKADKGFAPKPDHTLIFGRDVFLWTAARFADSDGLQLAVFTSRGIQRYPRTGPAAWGPAEDLIVAPNLFRGNAQEDAAPLRLDFLRDLDGDGLAEALYFVEESLWIFAQEKDAAGRPRFRLRQRLPLPGDAELKTGWGPHHRLAQSVVVPLLVVGDVNEDRRLDLMYLRKESVGQFIQRKDGRFDVPKEGALSTERKKARRHFIRFEAPPRVADFNGDGSLDVAVPDSKYKARVEIYFNRRGRPDFTTPEAVLNREDAWSSGIYVEDLDGDGRPEIIQGVIPKFGVIGGIRAFMSGTIDVELHFHRLEKGTFLNRPAQQVSLSIPYTFHAASTDSATADLKFWPQLRADLNGDGLRDLIVAGDDKELAVHFGRKDVLMSADPEATIGLAPPEHTAATKTYVADFNGDGRSDLVIRFETAAKISVIDVMISRKPN